MEEAEFPLPRQDTGRIEHPWAVHQAETTVDFARSSRVVTWLLGGLNFQIEHHLFPRICHVNYPALSRLVEETCRDFGIKYAEHALVPGGHGLALPLAAADGTPERDRMIVHGRARGWARQKESRPVADRWRIIPAARSQNPEHGVPALC